MFRVNFQLCGIFSRFLPPEIQRVKENTRVFCDRPNRPQHGSCPSARPSHMCSLNSKTACYATNPEHDKSIEDGKCELNTRRVATLVD